MALGHQLHPLCQLSGQIKAIAPVYITKHLMVRKNASAHLTSLLTRVLSTKVLFSPSFSSLLLLLLNLPTHTLSTLLSLLHSQLVCPCDFSLNACSHTSSLSLSLSLLSFFFFLAIFGMAQLGKSREGLTLVQWR